MAYPKLRNGIWHLNYTFRGKEKGRSTKIKHDGKYDENGAPVLPKSVLRELHKLEEELDRGSSPSSQTLGELLDHVVEEYEAGEYDSLNSLRSRVAHIRARFGNLKAAEVTAEDFNDYALWRRRGGGAVMHYKDTARILKPKPAKNATIKREFEVIAKALRKGKIAVPEIPSLKLSKRTGFFDDGLMARILTFLPEYLHGPILFGYYTGWRRSEVMDLKWSDVDLRLGEVRVWDPKEERARVFPIDAVPALRLLLEHLHTRRPVEPLRAETVVEGPLGYVFIRKMGKRAGGRIVRIGCLKKALATACRKAGAPNNLFHDLRRSAARNLSNAGWPQTMIMSWMGHSTASMFERYRIQSATDIQIVRDRMDEMKRLKAGQ